MNLRRRLPRSWAFKIVLALLALLMFYMGHYLGQLYHRETLEKLSATVLPEPWQVEPFELIDQNGQPFTADNLKGQWDFLFFGYTHCPDVCPTTLALLTQVYNRLAARPKLQASTRMVFVSVDPARDTPEQLKGFVSYFGPEFLGITGSEAEIEKVTSQLKIYYQRHEPLEGSEDYAVDHSAALLLADPEGRIRAIFSGVYDPATVAADFTKIADYFGE
jgi:protein SCO1/2